MRLVRLRLQNWRGVADRAVDFAATGVTVVEGPNEAGKSSLVEALDLLFDELDSSSKQRLRAVRPVHTDTGPEVEAEVETGPYRFVYAKRWHRRPQTTLAVAAPRVESHTGREAHERAAAILAETLDTSLWRALRIAQGDGLAQPDLRGNTWLGKALEKAAGGASESGAREESLFEAVRAERDRWWTATDAPRKEVAEADRKRDEAAADVARLTQALTDLESDVERAARLQKEVVRCEETRAQSERRAAELAEKVAALTHLRTAVEAASRRVAEADAVRTRAAAARDERRKLADEATTAEAATVEAGRALDAEAPGRESAARALAAAENAIADADSAASAARRDADRRERDFALLGDELELARLVERLERVESADRAAAAAEAAIERLRADDKVLAKLRALHEDVVRAEVRLESASASVRVEALGACEPSIDGAVAPLAAGETRELRVAGTLRIDVPGALRIDVRSGSGSDEPRAALDRARRALDEALAKAGVASLDEAVRANAALHDARRAVADRDRVVKDDLRDLTREALAHKAASVRARVASARDERTALGDAAPPLPDGFDAAQALRDATSRAAADAASALEAARRRAETARKQADSVATRVRDGEVRLRLLRERAAEIRRRLDERRAETPDETLDRALADADAACAAVAADAKSARDALAAAQPDVVEPMAKQARDAADRARDERHLRERELADARGRLSLRDEEGLAEQKGAAEAKLEFARRDAERMHEQAGAAKALFDAMDEARAAERARYVEPFRAKIVSLGRTVFGPDFDVTVDDALQITARTLAGRTVPFESLSGGAKEQLGVVSRLACAMLASDEGGVPVLLDDAFGWSDPERLERMGALLAVAGRSCQVVLLTCDPARHRHVPGATVVRLG